MIDCHLCLGACDPAYHASVRRVRQWLLHRVDVVPVPPPVTRQATHPFVRGLGDVHGLQSPSSKRKAERAFSSLGSVVDLRLATTEARKRASRLGGRARGRK